MTYSNFTDNARSYLEKILAILDIDATVLEEGIDENTLCYRINCKADDARILIGRNGQTLEALQFVVRQMCRNAGVEEQKPFLIDILDYRDRRKRNIEEQAKQGAVAVLNGDSERVHLNPMSPFERRIVHQFLQTDFLIQTDFPDLVSQSDGEGEDRHIVISYGGMPGQSAGEKRSVDAEELNHTA